MSRFFESYYRLRPVNATFTGIAEHGDRLPDWSPEGLESAVDEMRSLRRQLAEDEAHDRAVITGASRKGAASGDIRAATELPEQLASVDRRLADGYLEIQIAEHEGRHFQRGNPSLWAGEALFGVIAHMIRRHPPFAERLEFAAARLAAIPSFLQSAQRSIDRPIPASWVERTRRECGGAAILLSDGIEQWIRAASAPVAAATRLRKAATTARSAFAAWDAWLATRADADPAQTCAGEPLLDLLLRRGHCCTTARRELLEEARMLLESALAELHRSARGAASGGWPEVEARLSEQTSTVAGYYADHTRIWEECHDRALVRDLVTWPDAPLRYVPIPEFTRDAAPSLYYLFYRSPAPFDPPDVHDYVVTPIEANMPPEEQARRLRASHRAVIKLNHVVHHGAIGNHVQNAHARVSPSRIGRVAAVDCASRIGMFCGGSMAEGWACYATDLMDEVGFLTDLERIAEQHTRARLLARAVVDLSLHAGEMGLDEAAALYADRIGMAPAGARSEAVRNSMFPGAAVMYWLGTRAIHELRADLRSALGPTFSLRAFHDTLLSYGSLPPLVVGQLMRGAPVDRAVP